MTRVFDDEGRSFAVTKIAALPCVVSQIKDKEKDKYKAVQVSAYKGETSPNKGGSAKKIVKVAEFKETSVKKYKAGDEVTTKQFKKDETVTVEGTGKGKGFAGTIKRHDFARGPMSHGSKNKRQPGSIGGGYPERVVLGRKMPGRLGGVTVTVKNLRVVDVDDQFILVAGSIPGANKSIVKVYGKGEKAEEIVDHAAEEERLAQEKMMEADKEAKEEKKEVTSEVQPSEEAGEKTE